MNSYAIKKALRKNIRAGVFSHFARRHSDYLALICIHRFINFSDKGFPALLFIQKDLIPHRKGQPVGPPAILIKLPRAGRDAFGHQTDFSLISTESRIINSSPANRIKISSFLVAARKI